jgi:hypothetical protein
MRNEYDAHEALSRSQWREHYTPTRRSRSTWPDVALAVTLGLILAGMLVQW